MAKVNKFDKAKEIVEGKLFNKDRKYPPFSESMETVAKASSEILKKNISAYDICIIMVMIKLDRETSSHKDDNILDALAYLGMSEKVTR